MKKILILIISITFFIIIILELSNISVINTFKNLDNSSFSNNNINGKIIEDYYSENNNLKNAAIKKLKEIALKDMAYENWNNYIDLIELKISEKNFNNKDILFIILNLSKDNSVIGIYEKNNDNYKYINRIENLVNVKNIEVLKDKKNNRDFLLTYEYLDERFGAYFYDYYIRAFTNIDNKYKEVLRQSLDYEAFIKSKWLDSNGIKDFWYKIQEKASFTSQLYESGTLGLDFNVILSKYISDENDSNEIPENFNLVEKKEVKIDYRWSEEFKYFLQGFAKLKSNSEIVGIILDSDKTSESLLNIKDRYFKIIDSNGKIKYVDKDELILVNYN